MFFLFTNLVLEISLKLALCTIEPNGLTVPLLLLRKWDESIGNLKFYIDEQSAIESKNGHGIESGISIFDENTCNCMQFVVVEVGNSIATDSFECVTYFIYSLIPEANKQKSK